MTMDAGSRPPVWGDLTIAVPVYSRPLELRQLLASIAAMTVLPGEVLLCEDHSPDRAVLAQIAAERTPFFAVKGCSLKYVENPENLGYDGNIRNLFAQATRRWVMLLGNDDAMLPDAVPAMQRFIAEHPGVHMISRTFVRFRTSVNDVVGVTRLSDHDRVYTKDRDRSGLILRLCGFVGGLLVDRDWARSLATKEHDGTLYYQMYLAAVAYSSDGIGYIASPLVGSRAGNAPMFGSASAEKGHHVPGAYSPRARAAMWRGIMSICAAVERHMSVPLLHDVKRELSGRQSFHVFELVMVQGRGATWALAREFQGLGLMRHPLPWALTGLGLIFGRSSRGLFAAVRGAQKWRARSFS
ncbi:MAG TPA: glycosyltransferase family 2 protein [Steroidobacteraceae bacterium]|nr:glycosyltransferase family 2 protein [Steroidobacteraceae bacterium]